MHSLLHQLARLSHRDLKRLGRKVAEEIRRRRAARQLGAEAAEAAPPAAPTEASPAAPLGVRIWGPNGKGEPRRAA
jgi:hypothetical protein